MSSDQILYALLVLLGTTAVGYWAGKSRDRSNKEDDILSQVVKDVAQLKASSVSESRVREIIKDAIEPTGTDVKEIKTTVYDLGKTLNHIQLKIDNEIAYRRGRGEREE